MQIDGLMASMLSNNLNGGGGGGGSGGGSPEAAEAALSSLASAAAAPPGTGGGIPAALHNLQRLLQSQLAGMNPLQLQQVLQRQQVRKPYSDVPKNLTIDCVNLKPLTFNLFRPQTTIGLVLHLL